MLHRTSLSLALVATALLGTGCLDGEVDDDLALDTEAEALTGTFLSTFQRGLVGVVAVGDPTPRVGLVIGPNRVFVHRSWTDPVALANLSVQETDTSGTVATKRVRWVQPLWDGSAAIVITDPADPVTPFFGFDARTAAALVGVHLDCVGYRAQGTRWGHLRSEQRVVAGTAEALQLAPVTGSIAAGDLGTVCYDPRPGSVAAVGYVTAVTATGPVIRMYRQATANLAQFEALLALRARSSAPSTRITTQFLLGARQLNLTEVDSCLDIPDGSRTPGAAINYYPCHGQANQRFVRDTAFDPAFPRLIAEDSGLCIDASGGVSGADLHLATCGAAASQRWQIEAWPATAYGTFFRVAPRSATTTCLAVDGWSRATVRPVEQRACVAASATTAAFDQRWRFVR